MELNTGTISVDDIEDEVAGIARILAARGSPVVLVTYGFGCSFPGLDPDAPDPLEPYIDIPVATPLLAEFVGRAEEDGVYRMGRSDLFFKTDDGRASFLLCDLANVLCRTDDPGLFGLLSDRWGERYPDAYEADRHSGRYRRLSDAEWLPFSTERDRTSGSSESPPN